MLQLIRIFPFVVVLTTVWIVDSDLPHGTVTGKYFHFYSVMVFIAAIVFVLIFFDRKTFRFSLQDVLVILFYVSGLSVTWFQEGSLSNKWVILLLLIPLYFCLRFILQNNTKGRSILLFFLMITGLVEAFWGLGQLYGFYSSYHNLNPITGSFFNPGPYAGYLAMVAPIAVYYILCDGRVFLYKRKSRFWFFYLRGGLSLLTIVTILLILPSTMSRASWIAVTFGCFCTLGLYYRRKRKKQMFFNNAGRLIAGRRKYIVLFLACLLLAGTYYIKKNSADGRFLIWKISLHTIVQQPFGVGLYNFAGSYGKQQYAYFSSGAGSAQERHVAGSPDYGFNEYLQIGVEHGIHGLLLFLSILFLSLYTGIKKNQSAEIGALGSLLIFAFMSYPFNVLPFVIVLVFLLASSVADTKPNVCEKSMRKIATVGFFSIMLIITVAGTYSRIATYHAYKQLKTAFVFKLGGLHKEALSLYGEIYSELKHERHFVFDYATLLNEDGQYVESNSVLRQGLRISCDPVFYYLSGINYQLMKDYESAESCFRKAADLVPNRLYPYYLLAKLYIEMGLNDQSCEMAKTVLTKEPKVLSQAIIEMREEAEKIIINCCSGVPLQSPK